MMRMSGYVLYWHGKEKNYSLDGYLANRDLRFDSLMEANAYIDTVLKAKVKYS